MISPNNLNFWVEMVFDNTNIIYLLFIIIIIINYNYNYIIKNTNKT
jgi:hypothetical protein